MPTFFPGWDRCGTGATGWMDGAEPPVGVHANVHVCWGDYSWRDNLQIINCGDYFVYGLSAPGGCNFRFCTV